MYEPHCAYAPLAKPAVPQNGNTNPVDAFIREKVASRRINSSLEVARAKLLRRLSLDLIGLPPTPQEVAAFTADLGPDAYERQLDR